MSFLGTIALVLAALVYTYSVTFSPESQSAFFVMLFILILGVVLASLTVGVRFIGFSVASLASDFIWAITSFVSIYFANRVAPAEIGISPVGETAFGMLAGVSEEWFFRLWLCAWIHKVTRSTILAIGISSFAWAIFHIARYSANPSSLWIVFLSGLPLGYITLVSLSADGPTFGHMLVNIFARR